MRKNKIFLVFIATFFMFVLTACVDNTIPTHTHTYGEWTMTKAPTETEVGTKNRVCECGVVENDKVEVLTDETVWTVKEVKESTCTETGTKTYTSVFGEVEVELALAEHEYEIWAFIVTPTETEGGQVKGACKNCGDEVELEIPALTETSVWTAVEMEEADYNQDGHHTYESIYGQVVVELEKFVAPYDGKTYSSFAFDGETDDGNYGNKKVSMETAWNKATLELDNLGSGVATAFPFRGYNVFKMIDPQTGLIEITNTPLDYSDPENPVLKVEEATKTLCYVDMNSGLIIKPFKSTYSYFHVLTPFEVETASNAAVASVWDNAFAVKYTYGENTYTAFIYKEVVYFGVSFKNELGEDVEVTECYHAPYLYVENELGELIASFGFNGEKEVELDGLEGSYTGEQEVFVSGFGTVTVNNVQGVYQVAEVGANYTIDAYINNVYFEITLDQETKTCTVNKPEVKVTFETDGYAIVEAEVVNKNIAMELPNPTCESQTFKGWFYDVELTQPVEAPFIPTEETTLYASWKAKVVINLVGVKGNDKNTLYLGAGDIIGKFLPKYTIYEATREVFRGWYVDETFENALNEEAQVTEEDTDFTVYAKWEKLPAYYGTRLGTEIWSAHSGNSSKLTLTIDENGKISGKYSGIVVDYNPETQVITWKKNASDSTTYKFWFDENSDVIAMYYNASPTEIGTDFNIFSKYQTSNKVKEFYGITCTNPDTNKSGYYAHLVTLGNDEEEIEILVYGDHIYSNIVVTDTTGNPLNSSTVKTSKNVVVKDAETGKMIFGVASTGVSFEKQSSTVALDEYFGTYTNGDEVLVLDGSGTVVYGEKTGTYKLNESVFEVYLEDNTEFYHLTLEGTTFAMVKPMVTVSFNVGEGHTAISSVEYNINVPATLPNGDDEGYVFNGYFFDAQFTQPVPTKFIPLEDTTLYAKYSYPAVLTIVYNNQTENAVVTYSVGDTAVVEMPVYAKHAFVGWYTTEDFQENTKIESEITMMQDITIYAKWETAPIYNNTYVPTDIEVDDKLVTGTSRLYTRTSAVMAIDPYGNAKCSAYPFNGSITISDYNKEMGTLVLTCNNDKYKGYIDEQTGIIILNYTKGDNATFNEVWFLTPFQVSSATSNISASYWNNGLSTALQYTWEGTTYSMFIYNGVVYFNVTFTDQDGNAVVGKNCYQTSTLYVNNENGELIAKFGTDGTSLQPLDGYEGTYTNGNDELMFDGVKVATLNGVKGLYALAAADYYDFDMYIENTYYEVTVNKETKTYTINKPMLTITFDAKDLATVEAITVNKNIQITLPVVENSQYVFRGWYADAELTEAVSNDYMPTTSTTLYAKWDAIVSLTIVYGNGLETVVTKYGSGDKTELKEPEFTNGQAFSGWYTDSEYTTPYSAGSQITEDTTVYCKWQEAIALYGEYVGFETWGSTKAGGNQYSSQGKKLKIDPVGTVTGNQTGKVEEYNPETGTFKLVTSSTWYYGFYDAKSGTVAIAYSSRGEDLGSDFYVYVKASSVSTTNASSSYWKAGKCRLIELTVDTKTVYIFVQNGVLYYNVTFTSTDGEVAIGAIYKANQVTILDSEGTEIASFVKGTDGLE